VTPPSEYRDPLEAKLAAEISAHTLMAHVQAIAAWERESGSPGETRAFDYIERTLQRTASRSTVARSTRTSACRWRERSAWATEPSSRD
jgi:hypothetical protein